MSYSGSIFDDIETKESRLFLQKQLEKELSLNATENADGDSYSRACKSLKYRIQSGDALTRLTRAKESTIHKINNEKYILSFTNKEIITQVEIYNECKKRKIDCFLEVNILHAVNKTRRGCIDLIIKINNQTIGIECKKDGVGNIKRNINQLLKYRNLDIPIIFINKRATITTILDILKDQILKNEIYHYSQDFRKLITVDL